jgi:hypothetical protein
LDKVPKRLDWGHEQKGGRERDNIPLAGWFRREGPSIAAKGMAGPTENRHPGRHVSPARCGAWRGFFIALRKKGRPLCVPPVFEKGPGAHPGSWFMGGPWHRA